MFEFPLGSAEFESPPYPTDRAIRNVFHAHMRKAINDAAKKALLTYFESNETVTPEMIINVFKYMQAYDWGESGIIEKVLAESNTK